MRETLRRMRGFTFLRTGMLDAALVATAVASATGANCLLWMDRPDSTIEVTELGAHSHDSCCQGLERIEA
jgi:hypothetical protein